MLKGEDLDLICDSKWRVTFLRRGQVVHHGYPSVGLKPVLVRRKWAPQLHISMGQVVGLGFKCCLQGGPF